MLLGTLKLGVTVWSNVSGLRIYRPHQSWVPMQPRDDLVSILELLPQQQPHTLMHTQQHAPSQNLIPSTTTLSLSLMLRHSTTASQPQLSPPGQPSDSLSQLQPYAGRMGSGPHTHTQTHTGTEAGESWEAHQVHIHAICNQSPSHIVTTLVTYTPHAYTHPYTDTCNLTETQNCSHMHTTHSHMQFHRHATPQSYIHCM